MSSIHKARKLCCDVYFHLSKLRQRLGPIHFPTIGITKNITGCGFSVVKLQSCNI